MKKWNVSKRFIIISTTLSIALATSIVNAEVPNGKVEVTVAGKDKSTFVTNLKATITDKGWRDLTSNSDHTSANGVYQFSNLASGDYTVDLLDDQGNSLSQDDVVISTTVKAKAGSTAKTKLTYVETKAEADEAKFGRIADTVYLSNGTTIAPNAVIRIVGTTVSYKVRTNNSGRFSVYVPAGTYNIIVENGINQHRVYKGIKVLATQTSTVIDELKQESQVVDVLKEVSTDIAPDAKVITGKAVDGTTVNAFTQLNAHAPRVFLSTVNVKAKKGETVGEFSLKVPVALGGKIVSLIASDEAGNFETISTPVSKFSSDYMKLKADTTNNKQDQSIEIGFADPFKILEKKMNVYKGMVNPANILVPGTDYTIAKGKIVLRPGLLAAAGSPHLITVTAPGYMDNSVYQPVSEAITGAGYTLNKSLDGNREVTLFKVTQPAASTGMSILVFKSSAPSINLKLFIPLTEKDTTGQIMDKIRTALEDNNDFNSSFTVEHRGDSLRITALSAFTTVTEMSIK